MQNLISIILQCIILSICLQSVLSLRAKSITYQAIHNLIDNNNGHNNHSQQQSMRLRGNGIGIDATAPTKKKPTASPTASPTTLRLVYRNNPIMLGTIPIYIIWYGTWTSSKQTIVRDFLNSLSNSNWLNIQTTYYQLSSLSSGDKQYASSSIYIAKEVVDNYSQGNYINSIYYNYTQYYDVQFDTGAFPQDSNAIYALFTSSDVYVDGFGFTLCGEHQSYIRPDTGNTIATMWVGDPSNFLHSCAAQIIGPNGDAGENRILRFIHYYQKDSFTSLTISISYNIYIIYMYIYFIAPSYFMLTLHT